MKGILALAYRFTIRARVAAAIGTAIAVAGAALLGWTAHMQREAAITQARDFAQSVHQLTLAGLTGMMITGQAERRDLFLDQIVRSNDIRKLRVVRGPAVAAHYGPGSAAEQPSDPLEHQVLGTGEPVFQVRQDGEREYLKAVMPALASSNYLGKDCLGCHQVPAGTPLGAVTLEISLDRINASIASFRHDVVAAGVLFLLGVALLSYLALSRSVTEPLTALADNLHELARGRADLSHRLNVPGSDEVAKVGAAFDRVLEKAQRMLQEERIATDVFEHALEGILVTDARGTIIKVNPAFTRTTGYTAEEAIGNNPKMLQSGQHDGTFYAAFWGSIESTGQWQGDIWNKRKNGEVYPEWLNISSVRDEEGRVTNYVAVFSDITERKRQEALITYQAHHDALTGLPNRVLYRDRLQQALAIARRKGTNVGVMFLDLDRFKFINDSLGHDVGDELLKQVARRLRGAVREADTVARLGGDEFTVLLPEIDGPKSAEAVAAKILEVTRKPYTLGSRELFVTSSVGIAIFPEHGQDAETLMKHADAAMYHIKEQGRAGASLYDPNMGARVQRKQELETDFHRAVENNELRVLYQPQLAIASGEVTGVEALLRWQHPRLGLLPAREFLAVAEESGLIIAAGEWALRTACTQGAQWEAAGVPLPVTVNLSRRQFFNDRLLAMVRSALADSGLSPGLLELEIVESEAMQDVERTIAVLESLSRLGVTLAIAEFGMGFHSAANDLKRMPIQAIKIDRALVRDLARDPDSFETVSMMAGVRRQARVKVVAVGVESREQLEILQTMRCDSAQGRFLGPAMDAEQVDAMRVNLAEAG